MHEVFSFVLAEGLSSQAKQHNTIHAPDSFQCNISLTMSKDVWTQVTAYASPTQAQTLNFLDCDCPCWRYGKVILLNLMHAIKSCTINSILNLEELRLGVALQYLGSVCPP